MVINETSKYEVAVQLQELGSLFSLNSKKKFFNCEVFVSEDREFPLVLMDLMSEESLRVPTGTELMVKKISLNQLSKKFKDKPTTLYLFTKEESDFTENLIGLEFSESEVKNVLKGLVSKRFRTLRDELSLDEASRVYFYNEVESAFNSAIDKMDNTEVVFFDALGFEVSMAVNWSELSSRGLNSETNVFFVKGSQGPQSFSLGEAREFIKSWELVKTDYFKKLEDYEANGDDISVYPYYEEYRLQL